MRLEAGRPALRNSPAYKVLEVRTLPVVPASRARALVVRTKARTIVPLTVGSWRQSRSKVVARRLRFDGDRSPYQYLSYQRGSTGKVNRGVRSVSTIRRTPSSRSSANDLIGMIARVVPPDCCVCWII
jgi:hypothetical protein